MVLHNITCQVTCILHELLHELLHYQVHGFAQEITCLLPSYYMNRQQNIT